ncbi:MAG: hypothetical protein M1817_006133 [Caeruleum heppii]|nr:MAG: hypothetical protein M1817_006133 [Caeruleum heppii]
MDARTSPRSPEAYHSQQEAYPARDRRTLVYVDDPMVTPRGSHVVSSYHVRQPRPREEAPYRVTQRDEVIELE